MAGIQASNLQLGRSKSTRFILLIFHSSRYVRLQKLNLDSGNDKDQRMLIFTCSRVDSAETLRESGCGEKCGAPGWYLRVWSPPPCRSALSLHLQPLRMNTSCTPSFQTGGAFTRSPPIGALVEPPRLRPVGWNLTPSAEAAQSVQT